MVAAKNSRITLSLATLLVLSLLGCAAPGPQPPFSIETLGGKTLWLPVVRNSTDADLRLPGTNPLRSLGEMAGKIAPDYRPTVMELLRASLKRELEQRKVRARLPEEHDQRFSILPLGPEPAARIARQGGLEGSLFLSEIKRWDVEAPGLMRLWVDFKLVRIADGGLQWERSVQKIVPANRSANLAETYEDGVREVTRELF
jgi:hypothetical protein